MSWSGSSISTTNSQPSPKASSLIVSGLSASALLTAVMLPDTGEYTSDAALTDSTTALAVPGSARPPTAGRSTSTRWPISPDRKSVVVGQGGEERADQGGCRTINK